MPLTMRPERNVKLTKQERAKLAKKIKKGWKSNILLPDYGIGEDGSLITRSDKIRRTIKMVKILDDSILIEKAIDNKKNIKIAWDRISSIKPSKDLRDALEVDIVNGSKIEFSIYSSFKLEQTMDYIIKYVDNKRLGAASNVSMFR